MTPIHRIGPWEPPNEVTWARGRLPDRTYLHSTFTLDLRASQDYGQPARYVVKVFDEPNEPLDATPSWTTRRMSCTAPRRAASRSSCR